VDQVDLKIVVHRSAETVDAKAKSTVAVVETRTIFAFCQSRTICTDVSQ
jgi:hypothetical protein